MVFFDFLYLLIYKFYASYKEKGAASTSISIVGGLQTLNVMILILSFQILFCNQIGMNKVFIVLVFLISQLLAYIRYSLNKKYTVRAIEEEWLKRSEQSQERMIKYFWLYSIISVVGCFGLAIFFGGK